MARRSSSARCGELLAGLAAAEHVPEPLIDVLLDLGGEGVEGPGIDQVAARVPEQPGPEVEIAEGAAEAVAGAAAGEVGGEGGRALDPVRQAGLVGEEHVPDHRVPDTPDAAPGAVGPLVGRPAERLVHLALIVQRHAGLHPRAGESC